MPGLFWASDTCHCAAGHPGGLAGGVSQVCASEVSAPLTAHGRLVLKRPEMIALLYTGFG